MTGDLDSAGPHRGIENGPPHERTPGAFWAGVWRVADPKITLASVASMFVGACAAARDGDLSYPWLAATALGVLLLEAAKNASGEIFDFDSGVDTAVDESDRSPFSGGKRVLVDGLMTRRQAAWVALAFYVGGAAIGLAIAALRDSRIAWIGVVGVALAFFYHAPPLRLAYRGLGELAVGIVYGPLIACGTYLVQRHDASFSVSIAPLLASLPLGLLIAGFLWVNEFPDHDADRECGKNTLVVRLGRRRASRFFAAIVVVAFLGVALLPLGGLPPGVWLGWLGVPHGVAAVVRLIREPERSSRVIAAQKWTLFSFLLLALGTGTGLLLAPGPNG